MPAMHSKYLKIRYAKYIQKHKNYGRLKMLKKRIKKFYFYLSWQNVENFASAFVLI